MTDIDHRPAIRDPSPTPLSDAELDAVAGAGFAHAIMEMSLGYVIGIVRQALK